MIIGYNGSVPPLSYDDNNGKLTGFDIEFAKAVCQQLGIEVEFKIVSWDKKETELKERNIDCIWNGLTVTDESRNNMKFTRIYMSNTQVIVIKKSDASKFFDLRSLSEEKISAVIGSKGEDVIKRNLYLSKSEHIMSDSQNNVILSLRNGNVSAIIIDYTTALYITSDANSDLMVLDEFDEEIENYAIGFRLDSDMTIKVNSIINKMFNDGSLATLANKYNMIDLYNIVTKTGMESDMDYIMSKGEMIIGIEVDSPPMNYYDEYGDLIGFDCELAKAVCSKLGIDAIFVNIEWDMKETLLNNKTIDCVWSSFTETEERRNYFSFTQPYLSNRPAVIIRKSDASKFPDAESLSKSIISAEISSTDEEAILNDPYLSQSNYTGSLTRMEAINGLKNGNFDAIVLDFALAQGIIANGYSELMIIEGIRFKDKHYAVGFRIGSDMTTKIDTTIYDMVLDDSLTKLSEKYDLVDFFTPCKVTDFKYITNNEKIIIGFDKTMSPMTYYDSNGVLTGFDIDFAKIVCEQLDIDVEFKEINWDQNENELKNRNINCIWGGLSVTDERREHIKFSRVYMNNKQVVVIRKSNIFKYVDLESLHEANIGSKSGSLGEETIKMYLPHSNYKSYFSVEDMFVEVEKGTLDAVIIDYTIAKDNINNSGFDDLLIVDGIKLMDDQYAIGFRYGSDITQKINGIIKNMTLDGTLNEIAKKYDLLNLYVTNKKTENLTVVVLLMTLYTILIIIV